MIRKIYILEYSIPVLMFHKSISRTDSDLMESVDRQIPNSEMSFSDKLHFHLWGNLYFQWICAFIFTFFMSQNTYSQTIIQVMDIQDSTPLIGLKATYLQNQGNPTISHYSDADGIIRFPSHNSEAGDSVLVELTYWGYDDWIGWIFPDKNNLIRMSPRIFGLNQVVVTGQYVPQSPDKAVQKIQVIDRLQIERMAAVSLKDVLANQLQIRISEDLILGSSMRIQGLSGENVKILIDGIPMIGRLNGDIDLKQINLYDIERIEIIEGPMSVNFGTNALAGTINLITKVHDGTKLRGNTYMESTGTFNTHLSASHRIKNHQIHLSGMRNFFNGWMPGQSFFPSLERQVADTGRFKLWKPREQLQGTFGYSTHWLGLAWKYRGSYFDEFILNRGLPRLPYRESAFDDEYYTTRIDHSLSVDGFINDYWRLNVVASSNQFKREKSTFLKNLTNLERQQSTRDEDQDHSLFTQWMSRGTFSKIHPKYKFEIGYDVQQEVNQGPRISGEVRSIEDYALFSTAEISIGTQLTFRPGLRIAHNSEYEAPLLPSLHIKHSRKSMTIRASYARGFRAPSLKELFFFFVDINHNIQGNPDLKAETSHNLTLNLQYKPIWLHPSISMEGGLFYNDVQNLITLAQSSAADELFTYFNVGEYTSLGGQIQVKYQHQQWSMAAGTSINGLSNSLSQNSSSSTLLFNREWNGQLSYQWIQAGLDISFFYKYQGRLPGFITDTEGNVSERFIAAYSMADLTLSKKLWKETLVVSMGCKNIFNVQNVDANTTLGAHSSAANSIAIGMGRYLFLGIQYNILK